MWSKTFSIEQTSCYNACQCTKHPIPICRPGVFLSTARDVARILRWGAQKLSAEGARIETPKTPRGMGIGEGCPPPQPRLEGLGERREPTHFWHIWGPQNTSGRECSPNKVSFFSVKKIHSVDDWGEHGPLPPSEYAPEHSRWASYFFDEFNKATKVSDTTGLITRTLGPSNDFTLLNGWICLHGVLN